ncbi:hypothetical protein AJ79_05680 [Helicocarpus griseus UAMH5409]|uniref:Uncharacterized protein n=1 Tax=Helicocarpus griseus UAMH5409 TaxID=1447875 RepID=A0A2B7XD98_9EURO|nr:hypothetical protein AJ79_05680 [Helicocarpus griseus UAMH5409]
MVKHIILPVSILDELIQLKTEFDKQLNDIDYASEPSYLELSDSCKEYMVSLQKYMFRSIDQKGVELRRHYQRQTAFQEAGDKQQYAEMDAELELLRKENDQVLKFISDETTRAGKLLMAVGISILRIQEKAENPDEMQRLIADEVTASKEELGRLSGFTQRDKTR